MTGGGALLVLTLLAPVALLAACLAPSVRASVPALLPFAPLPAIAAALLASGDGVALPRALLGLRLALDPPSAVLLGTAALLWVLAGAYAASWLRGRTEAGGFAVWWLLTLTGSLGVFVAADLISFYLTFAMVSLAAWGLVVHDATAGARRAGAIYVSLALLGEAFLLMAFVLLAAASQGGLAIRDVVAALPDSPWRDSTLLLLLLGFGLKLGLVPLHVWMPVAHPMAPAPASAALSGVVVKAGVIGLVNFLPFGHALPGWGDALAAAGWLTAFYAVIVGVAQANPKTVLAYSTVSQMGVIAAVAGAGLAHGFAATPLALSLYASHHVLVKGALFLGVGAAHAACGGRRWWVLIPAVALALSLGGLPLTGGALAKFAIKAPLGDTAATLFAALSAAGTTLLMLHFVRRLAAVRGGGAAAPSGMALAWLAAAGAAISVPFGLYLTLEDSGGAFTAAALWAAAWPVALGGALMAALWRWGELLPHIPEGDIVVPAEAALGALRPVGAVMERADAALRQWQVAGVSLLGILALLGAVLLAGR